MDKIMESLVGKFQGCAEGEIVKTCFTCGEPTHVIKLITPKCEQEFEPFLAPCYIGCRCVEEEDSKLNFAGTGIPVRYQEVDSNFKCEGSSYLYGNVRTGKTTAACSIGKDYLEAGKKVKFITMSDVAKHEFADKDGGMEFMNSLVSPDLLIIDDLGKSESSEWAVSLVFTVINERYNSMKDVIITSNFSMSQLTEVLSKKGAPQTAEAITRRIQDMCKPFRFGQQMGM